MKQGVFQQRKKKKRKKRNMLVYIIEDNGGYAYSSPFYDHEVGYM
jgi:hypothetical protein